MAAWMLERRRYPTPTRTGSCTGLGTGHFLHNSLKPMKKMHIFPSLLLMPPRA